MLECGVLQLMPPPLKLVFGDFYFLALETEFAEDRNQCGYQPLSVLPLRCCMQQSVISAAASRNGLLYPLFDIISHYALTVIGDNPS